MLLAAAVALLAGGCAGVPGRTAVVPASRIEAPRVQPFAVPPTSGDTPDGIVRGFIAAGKDFHQNHQVAREYLDGGGAHWQALAPVVVVDSEPCIRLTAMDGASGGGTTRTRRRARGSSRTGPIGERRPAPTPGTGSARRSG